MKKIILLFVALMAFRSANALIVDVQGEEVPEEGLNLVIEEGEEDILTGEYTMLLNGNLLSETGQISVRIIRSEAGIKDEFCCGNNCTAGNGENQEDRNFTADGLTSWYIHYMPVAGSDATIRYIFDDGVEQREIRVRYVYAAQAIDGVCSPLPAACKTIRNGQVIIRSEQKEYNLDGIQL